MATTTVAHVAYLVRVRPYRRRVEQATALAIAVGQRARVRLAPVNDDADREDWGEAWEAFRKRTGGLLLRRGFASGTTQRALRAAWAPPAPILHVVPSDPTITLV